MQKEAFWENLGFDESNNGQFPAVYVSVFSNYTQDIKISDKYFSKKRKNHKNIQYELQKRHYSFLLFNQSDSDRIPYHKRTGIILASLVYEEPINDFIRIYADGEYQPKAIDFAKDILEDVTGLKKDCIEIYSGKDFDRKVRLVNIADETAHWLLKKSIEKVRVLEEFKHIRKEFLFNFE